MARESEVGKSQSDVKEITQNRVGEHTAVICREIKIVHCAGQVEVGIGIETLDETNALVAQITLHLKVSVEGERRIVTVLESTTELAVQGRVGEICDVVAHARDSEPPPRVRALGEITPVPP